MQRQQTERDNFTRKTKNKSASTQDRLYYIEALTLKKGGKKCQV